MVERLRPTRALGKCGLQVWVGHEAVSASGSEHLEILPSGMQETAGIWPADASATREPAVTAARAIFLHFLLFPNLLILV